MAKVNKAILILVFALFAVPATAAAQTFTAVLTDAAAKGKNVPVLGTATLTLDDANDVMAFSIFFRSDLFANQQVSINVGTPTKPGPAIFVLAAGQSLSPIEGAVYRGAEIPQPSYGIYDWDDAINAMFQNKTFLRMESPSYPAGVSGRIKRY